MFSARSMVFFLLHPSRKKPVRMREPTVPCSFFSEFPFPTTITPVKTADALPFLLPGTPNDSPFILVRIDSPNDAAVRHRHVSFFSFQRFLLPLNFSSSLM